MTLKQAVKRLGGPNRATTLYNLAYLGQRDALGDRIEPLARSTLETWINGTSKTKATDTIKRMIDLSERRESELDALYAGKPKPKGRSRRGKTKTQAGEARDVP